MDGQLARYPANRLAIVQFGDGLACACLKLRIYEPKLVAADRLEDAAQLEMGTDIAERPRFIGVEFGRGIVGAVNGGGEAFDQTPRLPGVEAAELVRPAGLDNLGQAF